MLAILVTDQLSNWATEQLSNWATEQLSNRDKYSFNQNNVV
jgi:hypothetical protein